MIEVLHRFAERLRPRLYLWIALAVAVPRLAFVAVAPSRNIYGNAPGLLVVAKNIADGHGYLDETGQPDSYFNPGYPTFLALCRYVSGDSLLAIKLTHVALDIGTALAVTWVLATACSTLTALLFAAGFALHPLFIHLGNNVNDEPLLTFLVAVSFFILYRAVTHPTLAGFAGTGVLIALATYTKGTPIFLPFAVAPVLAVVSYRKSSIPLRCWATFLCVYIAALAPWAYRNYVVFGHFTFSIRGIGTNLWWGSEPKIFTSYGKAQRVAASNIEREMELNGLVPPPNNNVFDRERWRLRIAVQTYKELLQRPAQLVKVLFMKATRSLYASEDRPSVHLPLIVMQLPVVALGLVGFWRLLRDRTTVILGAALLTYVGYFYLSVTVGMPIIRYFVPALPQLLAAAAVGLTALAKDHLEASPPKP